MQIGKFFTSLLLTLSITTLFGQQQPIDRYFCNGIQLIVDDAANHFVEQTNRDRVVLLNPKGENRFEANIALPGFFFGKIISLGVEGLYYESIAPNIPDSATLHYGLNNVDRHLLHCIPNLKRAPLSDSLHYNYYYTNGDTIGEIFIRMRGDYPFIDEEDSFATPGFITLQVYGDDHRRFTPYQRDKKKKDSTLTAQFAEVENALLADINSIKGKASEDIFKNPIWLPKKRIKGVGNTYIKPMPEALLLPYGYYAELYAGPSKADAEKVYKQWGEKVKHNAFTSKNFSGKNNKLLQWHFLPYNEWFDPDDYANIVKQVGFSAPNTAEEPINRTPLFTYHLFLMDYAGDYIVAINIGNRY